LPVAHLGNFVYVFLENITIKVVEIKLGYKLPSVENAVKTLRRPLLLIHGQRDTYISVEQGKWLYSLAAEPKALLEVSGARHNESVVVNKELYQGKILEFLQKYL